MRSKKPNLLFLMTDQFQGNALQADSQCITPHLDRLAAEGIRFTRAYTPNPVCSPARASLMTGLLPHNHGVMHVTHTVDDDQSCLRSNHMHWAQRLQEAHYNTGYFGKWHIERTNQLNAYGWNVNGEASQDLYCAKAAQYSAKHELLLAGYLNMPSGYDEQMLMYGVTETPPEHRGIGVVTSLAIDFLEANIEQEQPWCCFVSASEPHDPFICGREAYAQYDVNSLRLPDNASDFLIDKPALYRRSSRVYSHLTELQRKQAMACYYASITEIDNQFGSIIQFLRDRDVMDSTIIIFTSDHGELLGSHGLYYKNIGAFEEVYTIPLIISAPEIVKGVVSNARVGLHDLCPTLLELTGCSPINGIDAASFAKVLRNPECSGEYQSGYAEYHGGRYMLTQRILWDNHWKLVFNGFDFDELYHLYEDPFELHNLVNQPERTDILKDLYAKLWQKITETKDHALINSQYPPLRLGRYGPGKI